MRLTPLQRRCVELLYRNELTHVSSVLNTVGVIDIIYDDKHEDDPFVLGNSHAALALFVVLEKHGLCDAADMLKRHGTHACRDMEHGIWVSGGSLGQAETVAVGLALSNQTRMTYLVTSDGACMEGATWEAMRIAKQHCPNLWLSVVYNGYGAYSSIPLQTIQHMVNGLGAIIHRADWARWPRWMSGLAGHYVKLNDEQYRELMAI